jgi:type IV pilus assembly protein PilV
MTCRNSPVFRRSRGFSMIEVLVALLIIVLGLLGLAGLQVRMQQSEFESYQRAQALILLQDMVDRIRLHSVTASCFGSITTDPTAGTPYLGTGATATPVCTVSDSGSNQQAINSMLEWSSLLQGAAETKGGVAAGAMVGARGCVTYNHGSELRDADGNEIHGTGIFTVAVSWQGTIDTFAPTVNCANGQYGPETRRRTVSMDLRRAELK